MKRSFAAAALVSACAAQSAWSLSVGAGATETLGSQNYAGTAVFARFRQDELSLRPVYSQYHSDVSNGTYKTLSARGAYDADRYGAGLTVGGTPAVNGYSDVFFGVDGVASLLADEDQEDRLLGSRDTTAEKPSRGLLSAVDIGAGVTHTEHRDESESQVVARGRRGTVTVGGGSISIGQTDLRGWISGEAAGSLASFELTKSVYDRDLSALSPEAARVVRLSGFSGVIQGFPDVSASARYEFDGLPVVSPFASYTYTTFELDQPHADIVTVGLYIDVKPVTLNASYEHYGQSGQSDRSYYAFGGSVKF